MNAAGRRQRQAKNDYKHLAPQRRPRYLKRDALASRRRLDALIATERRMQQGKKKK